METTELRKQLYQLNNFVTKLLVENVDEETGDIKEEEVFQFLQAADMRRNDLLSTAVITFKHYKDLAEHVESKLKQMRDLKNQYTQFQNTLKNVLNKFLEPGEVLETEDFRVSWRKSQSIEKVLFLDLEEFSKQFPNFVKVTYELKKNELKQSSKSGILPEGIKLVTNNNLQIK